MIKRRSNILVGTICAATLVAAFSNARAQQATTTASNEQSGALEEVVVTAEKRSEDLQKTPIVVTVVTGAELETQGKNTVEDIFNLIPDVRLETNAEAGTQLFIRGIGPSLGTDPDVSFFVDGINQDTTTGTSFDLTRVEVLRGPQGTLYGRNAAGGAANIITNNPTDQFDASASVQVGNYNALRTEAVLNSPLATGVDMRLAALEERHTGYLSNGSDDEDTQAVRLKLLIKPNDDVSILLAGSYGYFGGAGVADTYPSPPSQPYKYCWCSNPADDPAGRQDSQKLDLYGQLDWNFGWSVLTYLPAWYDWRQYRSVDDLGVVSELNTGHNVTTQDSQELRLASPSGSKLTWVAGLYYLRDVLTSNPFAQPLSDGKPGAFAPLPYYSSTGNTTTSYAAFGQGTLPITDKFRVTGGVRYTDDKKTLTESVYSQVPNYSVLPTVGPVLDAAVPASTTDNSWNKVTWLARAEYDLAPQSMLYASVSTGYKSGGQNTPSANPTRTAIIPAVPYAPENLIDYEAGIKNRFFDNRVQFNADVFYYNYKDIQEFIIGPGPNNGPPAADVVNAATAKLYGVETSGAWSITRDDQLTAAADYENTRFGTFLYPSLFYGVPPSFLIVRTGESLPDAPRWTGNVGYQHVVPLPNNGKLTIAGQFREYTHYTVTVEPAYNAYQPGFHESDAHLTYTAPDGKWNANAYVDNIENYAQIYFAQNIPPLGIYRNAIAPPRTYGVSIAMHY